LKNSNGDEKEMQDHQGYRQLIVWQKALDLVSEVYGIVKDFPREERFGLSDQIRRSVVSVVANIAEGHGRNTPKEFGYFLRISRGSLAELDTLMDVGVRLGYVTAECRGKVVPRIGEVRKMLFGLSRKLKASEV
jgi:four helix bundle protein